VTDLYMVAVSVRKGLGSTAVRKRLESTAVEGTVKQDGHLPENEMDHQAMRRSGVLI
jgi:hypothetical protein